MLVVALNQMRRVCVHTLGDAVGIEGGVVVLEKNHNPRITRRLRHKPIDARIAFADGQKIRNILAILQPRRT